jgi:exopolysaccharide biosynthesis polyprenyl glycosylphosphotransferase
MAVAQHSDEVIPGDVVTVATTPPPAVAPIGRRYSSRQLKAFTVALDVGAVAFGMALAFVISRLFHLFRTAPVNEVSLWFGLACLPLWTAVFAEYGLFKTRRIAARLDEFRRLVHATLACAVSMAALSFLLKLPVSRGWLIISVPAILAACLVDREVARHVFSRLRRSRRLVQSVVLVGSNAEAVALCDALADPALGYQVVAVVDDVGIGHLGSIPIVGTTDEIGEVIRSTGATTVMVATTAVSDVASNRLVRQVIEAGVHVELSSSLRGISAGRLRVRPLGASPLIYVEPVRRGGWRAVAKRAFDMVGSAIALVALSPLLVLVALLVKLTSPGRVLFVQERVGKDAQAFQLFKFRTMVFDAESRLAELVASRRSTGALFKYKDDPRVTGVGRLLRRFSLDELPQLVNVLRGDMSLVGPRPALYSEMAFWTPELMARVRVRPGMTGMWQVSGRSDLTFADYVRHDLQYVENWSLLTDLAILAKTVPVVIFKRGAY